MYSAPVSRLLVYIFVLLISLPSLVYAQSTVNLTLDDGSMDEEFQGTGGFTVTRDDHGNTAAAINVFVNYSGSAVIGVDFSTVNLIGYSHPLYYVHIPAGQNSVSVTLTPHKDNIREGIENLAFTLVAPPGGQADYNVGSQVLAEMELTDDIAEVNLTLDDGSMDEANLGTGGFTVTRDDHGNTAAAINVFVNYSGNAVIGVDFSTVNLIGYSHPLYYVHIPAGQNSVSVTLTPHKDNIREGIENLAFTLVAPPGGQADYNVGSQVLAEMELTDDIAEVNLTLDDGTMDEEFQGTGGFTVTRDDHGNTAAAINVFVNYSGNAVIGVDFSTVNLIGYSHPLYYVHIPAGQNSVSVTLTPHKDNIREGIENLAFTLVAPPGGQADYNVGSQVLAEMELTDDIAEVNLTLDDGTMDEEFQGTGGFTVTRDDHGNTAAAINVFVNYSGNAVIGVDFSTVNLIGYSHPLYYVHIPAGQNSVSVTLTPHKDNIREGIENLAFTLVAPPGGQADYNVGSQVLAEMELTDDIAEVNLTLDDGSMDEANLGTGGFTVTRDDHGNKAAAINVFVNYSGNAVIGVDFSTVNLIGYSHPLYYVHIPAGQNSVSVTLTPVRELIIEGDESLMFTLVAPPGGQPDYNVGAQTIAELIIHDLVDKIFLDSFEEP